MIQKFHFLDTYAKEIKVGTWENLYTHADSRKIYSSQKIEASQVCQSTDKWKNKMKYIHKMEYSALKRKFWHMLQHGWTLKILH